MRKLFDSKEVANKPIVLMETDGATVIFFFKVLKVVIIGGLSFFQNPTFLLTKVLKEGNLFAKKVPSSANFALVHKISDKNARAWV